MISSISQKGNRIINCFLSLILSKSMLLLLITESKKTGNPLHSLITQHNVILLMVIGSVTCSCCQQPEDYSQRLKQHINPVCGLHRLIRCLKNWTSCVIILRIRKNIITTLGHQSGPSHAHIKSQATVMMQQQRERIRRAHVSKQGVSSLQAIWTNRAQVWTGGCIITEICLN